MQKLLFFSRVTFICNICFVISWFLQYSPFSPQGNVASTVVVLGVGVAIFLSVTVNFFVAIALLQKKRFPEHFPRWLIIANFLFLILQLIVFLK